MFLKLKKYGNVKLLSLFYICYNFRLYSVLAVIYFYQITHSYTLALSIFSISQVSQGIFEIPFGYYSDKYGRSNCLRVGALASLLSVVLYAIGQNYWILVIGAVFEGINFASFSGNNDALLFETLQESNKKDDYHNEYGKMNSWLELSGFLGVFIGGLMATVPIQAVTTRTDTANVDPAAKSDIRTLVFVSDGTYALARDVKTGIQDNVNIEILTGLTGEEEVIVQPFSAISKKLADSTRIEVVDKEELFSTEKKKK